MERLVIAIVSSLVKLISYLVGIVATPAILDTSPGTLAVAGLATGGSHHQPVQPTSTAVQRQASRVPRPSRSKPPRLEPQRSCFDLTSPRNDRRRIGRWLRRQRRLPANQADTTTTSPAAPTVRHVGPKGETGEWLTIRAHPSADLTPSQTPTRARDVIARHFGLTPGAARRLIKHLRAQDRIVICGNQSCIHIRTA